MRPPLPAKGVKGISDYRTMRVAFDVVAGDLAVAVTRVVEQEAVVEVIGGEHSPYAGIAVAAFRGSEAEVTRLDEATTRGAVARAEGQ